MRRLDGITDSMDMSLSIVQEMVKDKEAWHATVRRVTKSWTRLSDWTDSKSHMELEGTQKSQDISEKEGESREIPLPDFKPYYRVM